MQHPQQYIYISIHFLYTEEDRIRCTLKLYAFYFNPLPLYRGRHLFPTVTILWFTFQSTSSIQRKTFRQAPDATAKKFQSTSSIQRKTILTFLRIIKMTYFNPLPLYRGRQLEGQMSTEELYFNPLPLYRGRPQISTNEYPSSRHFISNFDIKAIILSTRFSKLSYV